MPGFRPAGPAARTHLSASPGGCGARAALYPHHAAPAAAQVGAAPTGTMRELRDSDFVPLTAHGQRWRFADPTVGAVAPHLERRVRPLTVAAAAEIGAEAITRHPEPGLRPRGVELDTDLGHDVVREWLLSLPVDPDTPVVVSWDAGSAVLTDWELVILHWTDICHPASDDVTIWSPGCDWTVCFWRHGLVRFSSRPRAV